MSNFKYGNASLNNLVGVHPDLVGVAMRALEISRFDIAIVQGVRDLQEQRELLQAGKTTTLMSNHIIDTNNTGYAHAIDIAVYGPEGLTDEVAVFRPVMQAFVTASIELGVKTKLGGLWGSFMDCPHIELDREYYK